MPLLGERRRIGRRGGVVAVTGGPYATGPTDPRRGLGFNRPVGILLADADCGRKGIERHALAFIRSDRSGAAIAGRASFAALGAIVAIIAIIAIAPGFPLGTVIAATAGFALRAVVAVAAGFTFGSVVTASNIAARLLVGFKLGVGIRLHHFIAVLIAVIIAVLAALFVKANPAFAEHPEIMVRELEVIFCLHAIPGELRIARHVLVFFEELSGIAALTGVAGVTTVTGHSLGTLSTAATTTAALTIIDQM